MVKCEICDTEMEYRDVAAGRIFHCPNGCNDDEGCESWTHESAFEDGSSD